MVDIALTLVVVAMLILYIRWVSRNRKEFDKLFDYNQEKWPDPPEPFKKERHPNETK